MQEEKKGLTYADAGVNIDAGNKAVELMKEAVRGTYRKEVMGDIGGFGGLFSLAQTPYKKPVLISGTDGVGTKLRVAIMLDKHDTIGQDVVAMSVNDILVQGAEPLFFLDYIAVGKLDPVKIATIVKGVADACKESGCALLGGESAEMAGFYEKDDYDLAGFAVGIVEEEKIITGKEIKEGDIILGLPSSGVHSNGFSLVRKIVLDHKKMQLTDFVEELGMTIGEALLKPTKLYVKACVPLFNKFDIKGLVHITGGGFYDNIPRVLSENLAAKIDTSTWKKPNIFDLLKIWGGVAKEEMYRTFNMGVGMMLFVDKNEAAEIIKDLKDRGEEVYQIGEVVKKDSEEQVILQGGYFDE